MASDLSASLTPLALLFHRHEKEVEPLAPWFEEGVEIIQQPTVFQSPVAEELAHVGVVLLLHVGLVVLVVGARSGLVEAVFPELFLEMEVEELASVIAILS